MALADALDAIPVVSSTTERGLRFPLPTTNQRVHNLATKKLERWTGSAWVNDFNGAGTVQVNIKDAPYNAVGDGVTDDTVAIQAAIDSLGITGGTIFVPPGHYKLTGTIDLRSNITLRGTWGGSVELTANPRNGSLLRWYGAINTPIVRLFGVQFVDLNGVCIDGAAVAGVTGILVDSANVPATRNIRLQNFAVVNCGAPETPTGKGVQIGASLVNNYQSDRILIENFHIKGCGYGIHTQSQNAMSMSSIRDGLIEDCNKGTYFEARGPMTMQGVIFGGSTLGPSPTYIDDAGQNPFTIQNCQGEGGTGNFLTVSANPILSQPLTLIQNNFDRPVVINAARRILSIGNYASQNFTLAVGASQVVSIQDQFLAGMGFVLTAAGSNVQQWTPSATSPFLEIDSTVEGDALRLSANAVNPGLGLKNTHAGGGDWDILFPATGGLLPAGFIIRNNNHGGVNPIYIDDLAPENAVNIAAAVTRIGNQLEAASTMIMDAALQHKGTQAGFFNAPLAGKPTVTGSRGANAALASLLTALATLGLVTDSSS